MAIIPNHKNRKGQERTHRVFVKVNSDMARASQRYYYAYMNGSYYIEQFVQYSTDKTKRRLKNKLARKQRKLNNRNNRKS